MVETPSSSTELKYRNVSIHSQAKTEHGTLYLLKHHACFSYYPGAKKGSKAVAHSRQASGPQQATIGKSGPAQSDVYTTKAAEGSLQSESAPSNVHAGSSEHANGGSSSHTPSETSNSRPKDIWIPYPMISYCMLRPSHAASIVARPHAVDSSDSGPASEDLFPPTFGTSGYERPSTDSARLAAFSTPPRPSLPLHDQEPIATSESARQPVIRIRRKDFQMMALHFNSGTANLSTDEAARQAFHVIRKRCCIDRIEGLHAFHYQPHKDESRAVLEYDARREYARMGISPKAADGPGAAWRISDINQDYSYSRTYPNVLCVPKAVSDNMLKYGGVFRSKSRIPCLAYLHSNGGSITRSSQPMVGVQNKRNPQDERLVSAIFSSHTPPLQSPEDSPPQAPSVVPPSSTTAESSAPEAPAPDDDVPSLPISQSETALDEKVSDKPVVPRIYGSTRRNLIVDARPRMNALANRATGGGIEDVANYAGSSHMPVERMFLNIQNIHVMRASLDKVIESFGSADYVDIKPNQETLRKSGWLGHIAGLLDGSEMVARVVGLGGSHVLVHCSDGWDRTAQVSALAQIMLDPHYRTLAGFISLVQKDFLSFGHKFRDRDGIEGSEKWFEIDSERIAPSRSRESNHSDPTSLNAMGAKAFTGAKKWFEKNRGTLFSQPNSSGDSLGEPAGSRSSSPPPNPVIHSPPSSNSKDEKERKMSEKEISPVFHQFLDAAFQLLHHSANAFEFNERFLRRLFYHAYACQYGEFLFNSEKDRAQHKLPSVFGHFLSRRQEFTNPEYVARVDDPLLFPRRQGTEREVEVRWWTGLFGRKDEDMNLPRALAPADPAPYAANLRASLSFDEAATAESENANTATPDGAIKETRSTPSLSTMRESLSNSFSSFGLRPPEARKESAPKAVSTPPDASAQERVGKSVIEHQQDAEPEASQSASQSAKFSQMDMDMQEGDPLGVSSSAPKQVGSSGVDFAAFASQNAFREL